MGARPSRPGAGGRVGALRRGKPWRPAPAVGKILSLFCPHVPQPPCGRAMSDEAVNTAQLNNWIDRLRAGDPAARDELLRKVCNRLERLARKMLQRFPDVRRWAQTDDVLQNALMRLM